MEDSLLDNNNEQNGVASTLFRQLNVLYYNKRTLPKDKFTYFKGQIIKHTGLIVSLIIFLFVSGLHFQNAL